MHVVPEYQPVKPLTVAECLRFPVLSKYLRLGWIEYENGKFIGLRSDMTEVTFGPRDQAIVVNQFLSDNPESNQW